jgi:hypothetical protein
LTCLKLITTATLALGLAVAGGCTPASSDQCRLYPEVCHGEAGSFCDSDYDCIGICCKQASNCGGGMCTFSCQNDLDCPMDMACEHRVCFYRCRMDSDCAVGQQCEHDNTICEWP